MRASAQPGQYPRPQLVRDDWTDLSGEWEFAQDDEDRGRREHWEAGTGLPLRIRVPFAPESAASGLGDNGFHPVVWYRRRFTRDHAPGRRLLLHFGAVDHTATVWVDGAQVGEHRGGQTAFAFDVTDALAAGSEHSVVVRVHDDPFDTEHPRGKQDWRADPHAIWYRRTTGIWKPVWLEEVAETHVAALDWSAEISAASVTARLRLAGLPAEGAEVEVELHDEAGRLARSSTTADSARAVVALDVPAWRNAQERERFLWSPENPVLIDAIVRVRVGGSVVDEVASYVGLREVAVDRGAFLLNGRPYELRSVLEQGYWEDSQLTPPSAEAIRREVELIKRLGFNAVRVHQKVEDARFLYWADRLGLLVWAETAAAYEFTPGAAGALIAEWTEIVGQQRNHPCVVTWVPVNESWGVQDLASRQDQRDLVAAVTRLTRALDPTRPVVSNDGWEHVDSDILTIHDYAGDPAVVRSRYADAGSLSRVLDGMGPAGRRVTLPGQDATAPVMLSEFGGIAFSRAGTWGYSVVADAAEFEDRLTALFDAVRASGVFAGFCYTQLTDTMQESNGLLTAGREPKLPFEVLRRIVTGDPAPDAGGGGEDG